MLTIDTVVIGAGHAGLAVSRLLTAADVDHVVLERGRVAERWRTERWDSLRLLTPAWMSRLPYFDPPGGDPDAFSPARDFINHLERYAASFAAPVASSAHVREVVSMDGGYRVDTDAGTWRARHVVIATGPHGRPRIPAGLDPDRVLPASAYRNPQALAPGGVLVVGASSSGVQIADELARSGRDVTLAVGRHTRMPRRYRGMDAYWWLHVTGRLARTIDTMPDPRAARREPSLQLVGGPGLPEDLDLALLQDRGVRLVGRVAGVTRGTVDLVDDLGEAVADADRRLRQLLESLDYFARCNQWDHELLPSERPRPVVAGPPARRIDLTAERIGTIVVAAGYDPDHPYLRVPVADGDGHIRQVCGRTAAPGLYVVGQRFQHRRDSGLIAGARHDARDVVDHLVGTRAGRALRVAGVRQEVTR
ncbi:MAG: NAD(P)/FAD-dependent oxidoreductase [Nocardioides sp.]